MMGLGEEEREREKGAKMFFFAKNIYTSPKYKGIYTLGSGVGKPNNKV